MTSMTISDLGRDQNLVDTHSRSVAANPFAPDHHSRDTHPALVGGHTLPPAHRHSDTHHRCGGRTNGSTSDHGSSDTHLSPVAGTAALLFAAECLDDVERTRIAMENRLRSIRSEAPWLDVSVYSDQVEAFRTIEHALELEVKRAMRAHPLGPWVKRTIGVGEKQAGRLIAAIGDLTWNAAEKRPRRGPAELWAYCGYHTLPAGDQTRSDVQGTSVPGGQNIAAKRQKGAKANWNSTAKSRACLVAEACLKAKRTSPYGPLYDRVRLKHADAVHTRPCARCGPSGHPAVAGSPLSDGHKHARALREVAKAVLRDMFIEARKRAPDHHATVSQSSGVGGST